MDFVLRFQGFDARQSGSTGSADIRFEVRTKFPGEAERMQAVITVPTAVVENGIPGMISFAATVLADGFRELAAQADEVSKAYEGQAAQSAPLSNEQ